MGFLARTRELARAFIGNDELYIDENNLTEKDIEEIILVDPKAMELLKTLSNRKKSEKEAEEYINIGNKIKKDMSSVKNVLNSNSQAAMRKYYEKMKAAEELEKEDEEKELGEK